MFKRIIVCFILIISSVEFSTAQNQQDQNPPLYITILVDVDHSIYVEGKIVKFDQIPNAVKALVYNKPASKYEGVIYRIYGDESLELGYIMDVGKQLRDGFLPLKEERYLLNLRDRDIDGSNYIKKLEKLDLKAIED